uniref:Retrotransposon gag domain-containing protein n=1 Tax=Pinguiococcus pyrenoidosus TaxID=172671 RepID=A0A7R9UGE5_9STRA|mmetsp:Transcript_8807/g.33217  ORF Transcript_8807/g.33217 Transcript_8807/m.33217 type:complete len:774 (+) Transcript_8807:5659-7980(+)
MVRGMKPKGRGDEPRRREAEPSAPSPVQGVSSPIPAPRTPADQPAKADSPQRAVPKKTVTYKDMAATFTPRSSIAAITAGKSEFTKVHRRLGHLSVQDFIQSPPSLLSKVSRVDESDIKSTMDHIHDVLQDAADDDVLDVTATEVKDDPDHRSIDLEHESDASDVAEDDSVGDHMEESNGFIADEDDFAEHEELLRRVVRGTVEKRTHQGPPLRTAIAQGEQFLESLSPRDEAQDLTALVRTAVRKELGALRLISPRHQERDTEPDNFSRFAHAKRSHQLEFDSRGRPVGPKVRRSHLTPYDRPIRRTEASRSATSIGMSPLPFAQHDSSLALRQDSVRHEYAKKLSGYMPCFQLGLKEDRELRYTSFERDVIRQLCSASIIAYEGDLDNDILIDVDQLTVLPHASDAVRNAFRMGLTDCPKDFIIADISSRGNVIDLVLNLRVQFSDAEDARALDEEFSRIRQADQETVTQYHTRFQLQYVRTYIRGTRSSVPPSKLADHFLHGLRAELVPYLKFEAFMTVINSRGEHELVPAGVAHAFRAALAAERKQSTVAKRSTSATYRGPGRVHAVVASDPDSRCAPVHFSEISATDDISDGPFYGPRELTDSDLRPGEHDAHGALVVHPDVDLFEYYDYSGQVMFIDPRSASRPVRPSQYRGPRRPLVPCSSCPFQHGEHQPCFLRDPENAPEWYHRKVREHRAWWNRLVDPSTGQIRFPAGFSDTSVGGGGTSMSAARSRKPAYAKLRDIPASSPSPATPTRPTTAAAASPSAMSE